jgi:zinc transporter 1/2/3
MSRSRATTTTTTTRSLAFLFFLATMSVGFPGKIENIFCSAAEAGEEETAMDHIMETFSGANAALEESELNRFLKAMATGGASEEESEEDGHGAHAHEEEAHADHDDGHVATHVTAAELLREYGAAGEAATSLTETEFTEACPELLKCAVDAECAFEYGEEDAASGGTANPSKSYTKLKAGLAAAVFGESVFGWMIPTISEAVAGRKARWVMSLLNAFSGGVFLSAGLTHLFPHLMEYQEQVKITPAGYPAGFALALTGYLFVFFIERVLFHIHGHAIHPNGHDNHCCETDSGPEKYAEEGKKKGGEDHHHGHGHSHDHHSHDHDHNNHEHGGEAQSCEDLRASKRPYILLAAISVHSVLAGLTLGVQKSRQNILTIFTAIAAHKAPAALSIGSSFVNGKASKMVNTTSMIIFSLTTTCGIFIGMGVGSVSIETVFVLEALASGTFLYGGTSEIVADEFEMSDKDCDEHEGNHVKKVHAGRRLSQRLALFFAYAGGAGVILLSNLALDGEHAH